jgi:hypothetical protein
MKRSRYIGTKGKASRKQWPARTEVAETMLRFIVALFGVTIYSKLLLTSQVPLRETSNVFLVHSDSVLFICVLSFVLNHKWIVLEIEIIVLIRKG